MKKYFKVSFQYSESVFCSNIAHAENSEDIEKHYSKYACVSIKEASEYDVKEAERKGMPIIEVEHIQEETAVQEVQYRDCKFYIGKSTKFDKDFETVKAILDKGIENITKADRIKLLTIYNPSYHKSGKIEGITSYDSTATNCGFCMAMRAYAKEHTDCICHDCYDYAQEHSFKGVNVLNRHTLNMLIMMSIEFTEDELSILDCTKINRINSSGDVPNKTYAVNMLRLAKVNEHVKFAFWAKNITAVIQAVKEVGKPDNMTLVQSSPKRNKPVKRAMFFDYVFTVYDNADMVKEAVANGACECNGKKCRDCGYKCYLNGWNEGQNIAELLRVSKARKAEIERQTA